MNLKTRIQPGASIALAAVVTLGTLLAPNAGACGSNEARMGLLSSRLFTSRLASARELAALQDAATAQDVDAVSVVGLWNVTLFVGASDAIYDQLLEQWHNDGTELANDTAVPPAMENICLGVWKQTGPQTVKLRHVGWNFNPDGTFAGTFLLVATITLNASGKTFTGTYSADSFDLAGKAISDLHAEGNLKGTRFEVDDPASGGGSAGVTIVVSGAGATPTPNTFETGSNQFALDASGSTSANAGSLKYFWTSAPGYPTAAIIGGATATPLIQLPSKGVYQFTLTVTDSAGETASAAITLRRV